MRKTERPPICRVFLEPFLSKMEPFLDRMEPFLSKMIVLPRQAQDRRRRSRDKTGVSCRPRVVL